MSRENELEESRTVAVVDTAALPATEISAFGNSGIPEEDGKDDDAAALRKKWFKEIQAWVTVLATLAASVTYQAGLNPPGGFWQADDGQGHHAGDPVLSDEHRAQYLKLYYLNATAFVTSLMIMVLLLSLQFRYTEAKVATLMLAALFDLVSLIGAYVAGTTRYFLSSLYVMAITLAAFVGVVYIGEVNIWDYLGFIVRRMPCLLALIQRRWYPVPPEVVRNAMHRREMDRERSSQTTMEGRTQRVACSPCCAPRADV